MSSQTDIELQAKNARLEALVDIHQQKINELERKVVDLELEKRLSAPKSIDQALQPAVSVASSDSVLRAEILRLKQEIAAKDEQMSHLRTSLSKCRMHMNALNQGFVAVNKSFDEIEDLGTVSQDVDHVLEETAVTDTVQPAKSYLSSLQINPLGLLAENNASRSSQPQASGSTSSKPTTADPPKESRGNSSDKVPQENTSQIPQGLTSGQSPSVTASPKTASSGPPPVVFRYPEGAPRFSFKVPIPKGFNPYEGEDLDELPDDEIDSDESKGPEENLNVFSPPQQLGSSSTFDWAEEPLSEPLQPSK